MLDKRKTINFFDKIDYKSRLESYLLKKDCKPIDAVIHLTDYCQHDCDFCYHKLALRLSMDKSLGSNSLNKEFTINLIDDLIKNGTRNILISGGGEPLLHPNAKEIISALIEKEVSNAIYTNLDIDIHNLEEILPKLDVINVNINTTDEVLYKQTRGINANVNRVKNNISRLLDKGTNITAMIVVRDNNIITLEKSINELSLLGLTSITVSPAFLFKYSDNIKISQDSILNLEYIKNSLNVKNLRILEPEEASLKDYTGKVFCKSHYFDITIGADYGVYPCCNSAYIKNNKIFDLKKYRDFSEGWHSKERQTWIKNNNLNCQTCWFAPINEIIRYKENK
jgi:radical SAM protein with 4Fe4S-binding SPASM domain